MADGFQEAKLIGQFLLEVRQNAPVENVDLTPVVWHGLRSFVQIVVEVSARSLPASNMEQASG